jgi:hypothetical protein
MRAPRTLICRNIASYIVAGVLALFCLESLLVMVNSQIPRIFLLDEAGYPDSYILYDVLHFQSTGVIYRDPSQPPYLPAVYSPLVYMFYSIPGRLVAFENPFLGPRLLALAAVLSCVALILSIAGTLIPSRYAWVWCLLLASTISSTQDWLIQLRGEAPGIIFSLLALRLLLARSRASLMIAGLCAGLSMQFKITLVTALAAGSLWLLFRKQWGKLAVFATAGTLTSAGLYLFLWAREPRMLSQVMALSPGVVDVTGCLKLIFKTIREPVVLLALPALPTVASRSQPRWTLLLLFTGISFVIAGLADLQAGGNVNYFFEALFTLVPVAVLGVFQLTNWARRHIGIAAFLSSVVVLYLLPPKALDLYQAIWYESGPEEVESENSRFRRAQNVLSGRHIFSTVPRLALLDRTPALTEPYLLSLLKRLGKFDPQPIIERIRNEEFDIVITAAQSKSWRGVPHISPDLHRAIEASYRPQCIIIGSLVHLPRNRPDDSLAQELYENGCVPFSSNQASAGPSW